MLRKELLALAKINKKAKHYILESLLVGTEHEILRLPPYHACFNPIELVWGLVKRYYDAHVGRGHDYSEEMMKTIFKEASSQITPQVWSNVCAKIESRIISAFETELGNDEGHNEDFRIIISLADDDDDEEEEDDDNEWCTLRKEEYYGEAEEDVDDPECVQGKQIATSFSS